MKNLTTSRLIGLLVGGLLLLAGAAMSLVGHSKFLAPISMVAIIIGLVAVRVSNLDNSGGHSFLRRDRGWAAIDKLEVAIYVSAALLFVLTIAAALSGYFNDVLTYAFAGTFGAAVIFYLVRRVL